MNPAFITNPSLDKDSAPGGHTPYGTARGHVFSVNVTDGTVHEFFPAENRPFLSEGQTHALSVYWYQNAAMQRYNQTAMVDQTHESSNGVWFYPFNFLAKDAQPVHFYQRAVTASLPVGATLNPPSVGQGAAYTMTSAGPAGAAISVSLFRNPAYQITSCRITARTMDNLAVPALDLAATTLTTGLVAENQISSSVSVVYKYLVETSPVVPRANFVVTSFSSDFLNYASALVHAGDAGSITLRAQIQTVVSPLASPFNPNFSGVATTPFWIWPSVVTLLSDHFPLVYRHPVTRSAYYGV